MYFLQQWFNLSDPAVEGALYDSVVMREFVGIDLGREPVPDETTICKFRHLLEEHGLGGEMLEAVNLHLEDKSADHHRDHRRRHDHSLQGGACVWGYEIEVRLRESALSRTGEERQPTVCHLRAGESVYGS
jgi:IS5 family transposase